jgi:protein O-GlcNAc transferase
VFDFRLRFIGLSFAGPAPDHEMKKIKRKKFIEKPDYTQLALRYFEEGNLAHAEQLCSKVLQEEPDNPLILYFLGLIHLKLKNYDSAIQYVRKSLLVYADNADAYHVLGKAFHEKGEFEEAIKCYKETIRLNPNYAEAFNNIGNILKATGRLDEAMAYYQRAIELDPRLAIAYFNLGIVHDQKGNFDEAMGYLKKALQIDPRHLNSYGILGTILQKKGLHDEAIKYYRRILELNPKHADAYNNLGFAFQEKGNPREAQKYYTEAIRIKPDHYPYYGNLLLSINYTTDRDAQAVFNEHLQFAKRFAEHLVPSIPPHGNKPTLNRPLRIGYVSPDFRTQSVGFFIEPVLSLHNHREFAIFCYANFPPYREQGDTMTNRMKGYADYWRNIFDMSDEAVTELVRRDEIDILVDLAGHSGYNRILVFARQPAPVQVSWLGYPNTTGLSTIHYRIVDNYTDPPGMTDQFYTEKLIRMPECFLCYSPYTESPAVGELPSGTNSHTTFGSFNVLAKMTPEVIALWSQIMKRIPNSRLILKTKSLADNPTRQYIKDLFLRCGITEDRLELYSWIPTFKQHQELYNRIDIGLDTFPYNGTTTTCDAMWMGVPVVTLEGNTHVSRVGVSLLSNVGQSELIARTHDEYVEIAVNLAQDRNKLRALRSELRNMLAHSPLTDAKLFTLNLEHCYKQMWDNWCKSIAP